MFGLERLVYETERSVSEEPGSKLRLAYETERSVSEEPGSKLRLAYETT